jgi:type II secretory pathway pseudopilin PulG
MRGHSLCPFNARTAGGAGRRAGFTLVEILVAASILVMALLAIATVLPTSDATLHQAGQTSKANALAKEMLEILKNDPFNQLSLYHGVDTRNVASYPVDNPDPPIPGDAGNFMGGTNVAKWPSDISVYLATGAGITNGYGTIVVATAAVDGSGTPVLRKVSVTVHWTEGSRTYQARLETLASAI